MTKQAYMRQLKEQLRQFDPALQKEILEDYHQHFAEGEQLGISEEEIIAELGSIEELIVELKEEGTQKNELVTSENFVDSEIYRGVYFDLGMADLKVCASDDGCFHLETTGNLEEDAYRFEQTEEDGIFVLRLRTESVHRFFFRKKIRIEAALPRGLETLVMKTSSGDLDLKGLQADQILCQSGSGDIQIRDSSGREMNLNSASGDIEAERLDFSRLEIETGSGDIEVVRGTFDHLELKTGSGDVECKTEADQIFCRTGSGDAEIEVYQDCDLLASSGSGEIEIRIEGSEGAEVSFSSSSGDVELFWQKEEIPVSKKGLELLGNRNSHIGVKSGSGDITIEID